MNNALNVPQRWGAGLQPVQTMAPQEANDTEPVVKMAAVLGCFLLWVRFGMVAEIQTAVMGFSMYLMYLATAPALLALVLSGGLKRILRAPPNWFWIANMGWIAMAAPFSIWRGSSVSLAIVILRTSLPTMLVTALAVNWKMCRWIMAAIAWGAVMDLMAASLFARDYGGRLGLEFGTVSNPNDFAAVLILVLPFLLFYTLSSKSIILRLLTVGPILYGCYVILGTGSRGAVVALGADALFFLIRGSMKQRLAVLFLVPLVAVVMVTLLPDKVMGRLEAFSDSAANREAVESSTSRKYLLGMAMQATVERPIFGVGPGEFSDYEGSRSEVLGGHGIFHGVHNSFLQMAAECGIPALILMVGGLFSTFWLMNRTYKRAKERSDCNDIRAASLCVMLGLVGFTAAIFFLNFAYAFYLPCLGGVATSMYFAAEKEIQVRQEAAPERGSGMYPSMA